MISIAIVALLATAAVVSAQSKSTENYCSQTFPNGTKIEGTCRLTKYLFNCVGGEFRATGGCPGIKLPDGTTSKNYEECCIKDIEKQLQPGNPCGGNANGVQVSGFCQYKRFIGSDCSGGKWFDGFRGQCENAVKQSCCVRPEDIKLPQATTGAPANPGQTGSKAECGGFDTFTNSEQQGECKTTSACNSDGGRVSDQLSGACDAAYPGQGRRCCIGGKSEASVFGVGTTCEGTFKAQSGLFGKKWVYGRGVCREKKFLGAGCPGKDKWLDTLGCADGLECCGRRYTDANSRTELDDDSSLANGSSGVSGAIIAVIVGAVVVALLICVAAVVFLVRRRGGRGGAPDAAMSAVYDEGSLKGSRRALYRSASRAHAARRSTRSTSLSRARSGLRRGSIPMY